MSDRGSSFPLWSEYYWAEAVFVLRRVYFAVVAVFAPAVVLALSFLVLGLLSRPINFFRLKVDALMAQVCLVRVHS